MAMIPVFLFLTLFQSQQELQLIQQQSQLLAQQQQQLQQVQQELRQQEQQLGRIVEAVDQARRDPRSTCSTVLQWVNGVDGATGREPLSAAFSPTAALSLNLFSAVSQPQDFCLPGEIRITASYFDSANNLLCSGGVENIVGLNGLAQTVNLEVRPWSFEYFVRWSNDPSPTIKAPTRLACFNPDGLDQVGLENMPAVSSLRLRITAFPKAGGLSTVDVRINRR
jgi:hypothetical protein